MVDYGGLAVLVIGGYILIKYGPQIAQQLQQQQQAGAPPPTAPGAADGTTAGTAPQTPTPSPAAFARTPCPDPNTCQSTIGPNGCVCQGTADCPANGCGNLAPPQAAGFRQTTVAPASAPTLVSRFQGVLSDVFKPPPPTSSKPAPACATSAQDAACGFKGHPKCCPNNTLLGTPLQTVAGKGPAVSTRAPKAAPPKRTGTGVLNPQCEGNPCGVTVPGKCLQSSTGNEVACTQSTKAAVAYSYMTQVVNGQRRTTIDPFFPAGFYLSQANYRASLKEPALH